MQAGYLLNYRQYQCCECHYAIELAGRYQKSDLLSSTDGTISRRDEWTSVGMNIYIRDHNLKIQTDYTFKEEGINEIDNNVYQMQLQFDY